MKSRATLRNQAALFLRSFSRGPRRPSCTISFFEPSWNWISILTSRETWWLPRSVPEMQYFHELLDVVDSIVNHDGTMHQFADAGASTDNWSHSREASQQIHMIEQGATEVKSCVNVVVNIGNPANNLVQIAQRSFCEDEAVIHSCICLRTSSIGTVRPSSASRMPSSMAARVSSSSSSRIGPGASR